MRVRTHSRAALPLTLVLPIGPKRRCGGKRLFLGTVTEDPSMTQIVSLSSRYSPVMDGDGERGTNERQQKCRAGISGAQCRCELLSADTQGTSSERKPAAWK